MAVKLGYALGRFDLPSRGLRRAGGGRGHRACAQVLRRAYRASRGARSCTARHGAEWWAQSWSRSMPRTPTAREFRRRAVQQRFCRRRARWATSSAPICAWSISTTARTFRARARPQYPLWSGLPAQVQDDAEGPADARRRVHRRRPGPPARARGAEAESRQHHRRHAVSRKACWSATCRQRRSCSARSPSARPAAAARSRTSACVYQGSSNDDELNRRRRALRRRSGGARRAQGRRRADRQAAGAGGVDPFDQRSAGRRRSAVGLSRRGRRPPAAATAWCRPTPTSPHTGQSAPELAAALDALMQWIEKGAKPTPQSIAAAAKRLRGDLRRPLPLSSGLHAEALQHALCARGGEDRQTGALSSASRPQDRAGAHWIPVEREF